MSPYAAALTLLLLLAIPLAADEPITKPIRYTWLVSSCETWNCAAAALVMANGDKHVMVLPTAYDERPWLVLRRVEEGSVYVPDEEPFGCEVYDSVGMAVTGFEAIEPCRRAMILNVPDGRAVVMSLRSCTSTKVRAVR
jgi:hypothetical protein